MKRTDDRSESTPWPDPELRRDLVQLLELLTSEDGATRAKTVTVFRQMALPCIRRIVLDRLVELAVGRREYLRPRATATLRAIGYWAVERTKWKLALSRGPKTRQRVVELLAEVAPANDMLVMSLLQSVAFNLDDRPVVRQAARRALSRVCPDYDLYAPDVMMAESEAHQGRRRGRRAN